MNIVLQGISGRMGAVLLELFQDRPDCKVVAGIDTHPMDFPFPVYPTAQDLKQLPAENKPHVVIDFSHPSATSSLLDYCAQSNLPCVICTTGLSPELKEKMYKTAQTTPVFYSANMSLGINLISNLVKKAQAILDGFDIEIIEKHHHNKLDAPSGTALLLADAINQQAEGRYHYIYERQSLRQKRDPNEIGIHALRGGSIVGEHDVVFAGPDEVITISHQAYSRKVFASGAITAAIYLADKPAGLYSMDHVLEGI